MSESIFIGFTAKDLFAYRTLLDELGITNSEEFCRRVSVEGIPPQVDRQIAYHVNKINKLKGQA